MTPEILIAEDDASIVELMRYTLEQQGYRVQTAADGEDALRKARLLRPDLLILDLMLPLRDGFSVCAAVRRELNTLVMIVSAKRETEDRILGLETGADDYLPKPFGTREFQARVKALLRRGRPAATPGEDEAILRLGRMVMRPQCHDVTVAGRPVTLTPKEFALLTALMAQPKRVLPREALQQLLWDYSDSSCSDSLYVHLSHLRRKIEPGSHCRIVAVKGLGYRLVEEERQA